MTVYSYKLANGKLSQVADIRLANKPRHRKKGFRNKTEAKAYETKLSAQLQQGVSIVSSTLKVKTYLDNQYKNIARSVRQISDYTHQRNGQHLNNIIPEIGHIKIVDLKPSHVYAMRKKFLNKLSPRTVFNLEVCFKGEMKDGEPDIFADSPIRKQKAMSKEELSGITGELTDALDTREKLQWFEPEEQQKLIETAKAYSEGKRSINYKIPRQRDLRPYIRIYLGVHTGMRSGEITTLTWNKINFEEGTISIRHNVE